MGNSQAGQQLNTYTHQWLELSIFTTEARIQSLVEELRSHKPSSTAKKKKNVVGFKICSGENENGVIDKSNVKVKGKR